MAFDSVFFLPKWSLRRDGIDRRIEAELFRD